MALYCLETVFLLFRQPLRIAALKYLAVIPSIVRYDILHPQRATVIRELEKALDDPKRVVRKEAVDARLVVSSLIRL